MTATVCRNVTICLDCGRPFDASEQDDDNSPDLCGRCLARRLPEFLALSVFQAVEHEIEIDAALENVIHYFPTLEEREGIQCHA